MMARVLCVLGLVALSPFVLLGNTPSGSDIGRPTECWDSYCYKTYPQIETFLRAVANSHPQLAILGDAGLSWEQSRHLWLMRLASNRLPGAKPAIYLLAGQHARDIATPEMLVRYISYLTQNYGVDPDVTWLLDNRVIWVMPLVNPDGYNQIYEVGNCPRLKNMDSYICTNPLQFGTDLNRNYPYQWNTGGAGGDPCDASYPGSSALSEPESQHVIDTFEASGAGLVLSLQAPGPSIRYPWGWSPTPPGDSSALDAFAWGLARLNGTPRSAVTQHNRGNGTTISGILDDTVYGQYGAPAFTMNIGDTPAPSCTSLDAIWNAQRPALLYATKAVAITTTTTLSHAFGPTARDLQVQLRWNVPTFQRSNVPTLSLTGVISANYGTIADAVYSIDVPGEDGSGQEMSGNFGGGTALVSATVDTSNLPDGRHLLLVQGKSDGNHWGVFTSTFFTVTGSSVTPSPTPITTDTPTPSVSATRTASHTRTPSVSPTRSPTRGPTNSPIRTFSRTSTASPSVAATTTSTQPTITTTPTAGCASAIYMNNTLTPIPTNSVVTSTLVIGNVGTIANLALVGLQIDQHWIHELTLSLTSPGGTRVVLVDQVCTHQDNFNNVNLDDRSSFLIGEVCPPAPGGIYRPVSPLAAFNGPNIDGVWTLTIENRGSNSGSLRQWGLAVTFGSPCYIPTVTPTTTSTDTPGPTGSRTPTPTRTPTYTRTPTDTRTPTSTRTLTDTRTPSSTRPPNTATPLPCADYTDVYPSQYFSRAVDWLTCRHIVSGYADGLFHPYDTVMRAQVAKMIVLGEGWTLYNPPQPTFSDVDPGDWYYSVVETAYQHGIASGYEDSTFHPYDNVTRAQLSKMIVLARTWTLLNPGAPHFSDVPTDSPFYHFIESAFAHAVISGYGDGTFQPQSEAMRGQFCKMLYVALTQN